MKKINNKILLLIAGLFFLVSTAFTINTVTAMDPYDCNICDALGKCQEAVYPQTGRTDCENATTSGGQCGMEGAYCWQPPE